MKLATLRRHTPDGELFIVSKDLTRAVSAMSISPTLQHALERWDDVSDGLEDLSFALESGRASGAQSLNLKDCIAPLPRAWQWLDGSAFVKHGELMQQAFKMRAIETEKPLMYQGVSDRFVGPYEDVVLPSEDDGIDFEGEYGVICSAVPMGTLVEEAGRYIRLVVQINDWSLRTLAPAEMKTGFGWIQAKPACSMAPIAVTPDELGDAWKNYRVHLPLTIDWNGRQFGAANGAEMAYGFDQLVAHACYSRNLVAGTVIGSGTVSNEDYSDVGSSCISERRAIDMIEYGEVRTPFMSFGDRVRMEARTLDNQSLFGPLDQKVVRS